MLVTRPAAPCGQVSVPVYLGHVRFIRAYVSLCLKCVSELHIEFFYGLHKPFDINLMNWVLKCTSHSGQTSVRMLAILTVFLIRARRTYACPLLAIAGLSPAPAATLLQLGFDEMTQKSSAIARVKVTGSSEILRGADVFTIYRFETLASLKAPAIGDLESVAIPGGASGGIRQVVAGAPRLRVGGEYVLFLWTSRSGLTQIIGLSQGLFSMSGATATRAAADEQMLDAAGRPVHPETLVMPWVELKARVAQAMQSPVTAARSK
jgi:hypothetical protein